MPQGHLSVDGRVLHGVAVQLHGGSHGVLKERGERLGRAGLGYEESQERSHLEEFKHHVVQVGWDVDHGDGLAPFFHCGDKQRTVKTLGSDGGSPWHPFPSGHR